MTATIDRLEDDTYVLRFHDGFEKEIHREELLALCLNSVHAYTRTSFIGCTHTHRQALASLHDALADWLGLQDEPSAFRHDVLGAAWLDVDGHDYILNSVEIDRDDFGIIGGRSIAMGREQAAQVVGLMVDALLSGNIEIGDALQLKARVNEQVARVQQGEQIRRLESVQQIAAYAAVASDRSEDRGAMATSIIALIPSEHDRLLEACTELGGDLDPIIVLRGSRELDHLRQAAQTVLKKLCAQLLDTIYASALFKRMADLGVGVKLSSAPRTTADMRAEACELCRMALGEVTNQLRKKMAALVDDLVVVNDFSDLYGDALGQIFFDGIAAVVDDPNDRELPEITKTRIDNEVDRWWNACLGEAFEKNALRALVTSRCELFGAVTRITPRSNLAAFKVYPIKGRT